MGEANNRFKFTTPGQSLFFRASFWSLGLLTLVLMAVAYHFESPTIRTSRNPEYGHNQEGDFSRAVLWLFFELAFGAFFLSRRMFKAPLVSRLSVYMICVVWTGASMLLALHSGSIIMIHLLWIMLLNIILGSYLVNTRKGPPKSPGS